MLTVKKKVFGGNYRFFSGFCLIFHDFFLSFFYTLTLVCGKRCDYGAALRQLLFHHKMLWKGSHRFSPRRRKKKKFKDAMVLLHSATATSRPCVSTQRHPPPLSSVWRAPSTALIPPS